MELFVPIIVVVLCATGVVLARKKLKKYPKVQRMLTYGCSVFGGMMLLYCCLWIMMTGFWRAEPPKPTVPTVTQPDMPLEYTATYFSLDGLSQENGVWYLKVTPLDEMLIPGKAMQLSLAKDLDASMLPGWDEEGRRFQFASDGEFALYWAEAEEKGFPAVGCVCRFEADGTVITQLREIIPELPDFS